MPRDRGTAKEIRVLVAHNSNIQTQLLADALSRDSQFAVFPASSSAAVHDVVNHRALNVAVISSVLDGEPLQGLNVVRQLSTSKPAIRTVLLLDSSKREIILEAFRAGVRGVFSPQESLETLCRCVRQVHEGQIWADRQQMSYAVEEMAGTAGGRGIDPKALDSLSKREREVVQRLAEGLSNREIAERMGLSQHTIKNYLFRIFDKLGVASRMELLFLAMAHPLANQGSGGPHAAAGNPEAAHTTLSQYQAAAEKGTPEAQLALARFYCQGEGGPKDPQAAYMWYLISENAIHQMRDSITHAKRKVAELLSTDEIMEAQQRAAERLKKPVQTSSQAGAAKAWSAAKG